MFLNPLVIESFANELVKTADLSPEIIGMLLGGAGGAGAGYGLTDDPRKKGRNALLGGLAGAAGGTLLGGQIGSGGAAPAASLMEQGKEVVRRREEIMNALKEQAAQQAQSTAELATMGFKG